jgi:transcriptional regulator with XRE-family HTH domain
MGETTEMTETESAKIIKNLRAKLGMTQEQFAAKVGVAFSTVNRWENGKGNPSPLARQRIEELRATGRGRE